MRLNQIDIKNFRCFAHQIVEFDKDITVVIGNNTAGKTSLLQAVCVALGGYLQCLKHLDDAQGVRCNFKKGDRYLRYDKKNKDYVPNPEPPEISVTATYTLTMPNDEYEEVPVKWSRTMTNSGSTTHNRESAGNLIDLVAHTEANRWDGYEGHNAVYPLILSFSTNRIDAQFNSYRKTKERQQRLALGYRSALINKVDFASAMDWLNHYDKSLKDGKEFPETREAFFQALQAAIPAMSEIDIDNREIEAVVSVTGRQPERHHYSYMSDGFKAMINIVSEIAYRCVMLNGYLGADAIRLTPGIVLIDEVDLYLHPHWQRHVLSDLKKAFPKIQFIVTTHSPFIIQSVGEGQLVSFDENVLTDGAPYKQSLEEIAATRMDMENIQRSEKYQKMVELAERYYQLVKAGKEKGDEAKKVKPMLDDIETEFSDDPAYVALLRAERGNL